MPPNDYFVMGDNRNRSQDSRTFGPIGRDRIDGRAWFRIRPLNHFGNIYDEEPSVETSTVFVDYEIAAWKPALFANGPITAIWIGAERTSFATRRMSTAVTASTRATSSSIVRTSPRTSCW